MCVQVCVDVSDGLEDDMKLGLWRALEKDFVHGAFRVVNKLRGKLSTTCWSRIARQLTVSTPRDLSNSSLGPEPVAVTLHPIALAI